ncbi:MAG: hypothetical protein E6772_18425 [Dysgonomonas sp.]|jgi:hypothetical protein|nr:hypothetical protein [Dysgonomonas sp.]
MEHDRTGGAEKIKIVTFRIFSLYDRDKIPEWQAADRGVFYGWMGKKDDHRASPADANVWYARSDFTS